MIDTTPEGRLPRAPIEDPNDRVRNYAVWTWHKQSRSWLFGGRFSTPQEAGEHAGYAGIVIDIVSDTQVWWRGAFCQRAKPQAVPTLIMEKYKA